MAVKKETKAEETVKPAKKTAAKSTAKKSAAKSTAKKATAEKKTTTRGRKTEKKGTLVIVESPAKAKTIEKYLGSGYRVIATKGHFRDLPKSKLGVDEENNFEPQYITIKGRAPLVKEIQAEAKKFEHILLATDLDREGEAISWHLCHILDKDPAESSRIVFNEITQNAIRAAVEEPRPLNMSLVDSQQARRVLDRLVGYKISPVLWKRVRKGLSAGRVQSAALRIICDREDEIEAFKPEEYWLLRAQVQNSGKKKFTVLFQGTDKGKLPLPTEDAVKTVMAAVQDASYVVEDVNLTERRRFAPPPFITSSLQQEAARKLGFTGKRTMVLAQQLYEGMNVKGEGQVGLISYMRTDSTRLSEEALSAAHSFITEHFGRDQIGGKTAAKKGVKVMDAHEAIRPTLPLRTPDSLKDSLTAEHLKLYTLIFNRFIASQMTPAVYDAVAVTVAAGEYRFRATGSTLKAPGYTALYTEGHDTEEEKEQALPALTKGELLKLLELLPEQHFTQPPARYTEAALIKILEEKGIGRPSTYAPIIETLTAREYVETEAKRFRATELGRVVTNIMKAEFPEIVDIQFTAGMETDLDRIESDHVSWPTVVSKYYKTFMAQVEEALKKADRVHLKSEETDVVCKKCGRNMVVRSGRFGKFLACPGYPECKYTEPLPTTEGIACPKCKEGNVVKRRTRTGKDFYGCSRYPDCDFTSWYKPTDKVCKYCGAYMVSVGRYLRCSNEECVESRRKESKKTTAKEEQA